jgi:hypothetical protein
MELDLKHCSFADSADLKYKNSASSQIKQPQFGLTHFISLNQSALAKPHSRYRFKLDKQQPQRPPSARCTALRWSPWMLTIFGSGEFLTPEAELQGFRGGGFSVRNVDLQRIRETDGAIPRSYV